MNERDFVKQKFAEYYKKNIKQIHPPASIGKREFGFVLFEEKMMVRHKGFRTEDNFRSYLASLAPSNVYYSSAYYERPEEPMEKKGWLGADLIFDIDADHMETPCKSGHEYWICEPCQNAVKGMPPEVCPRCGGSKFKEEPWLCETCLETAKKEIQKLVEFLVNDLGFQQEEIEICFSGQRGYHACVSNIEIQQIDQTARKEIVDYISGTGLNPELYGWMATGHGKELTGRDLNDPGWYGRVAKGVYGVISSYTPQQMEQIGIKKAAVRALVANRDFILRNWSSTTNWRTVKGVEGKVWSQIIEHVINKRRVGAVVDSVVTTDTHRLIRLPFSLHGKTGLMAVKVPADSLDRFDPLRESVAFMEGALKIRVNEAHRFRIGDEEYGPYDGETVTLPMAAAVYLLCKRAATLA